MIERLPAADHAGLKVEELVPGNGVFVCHTIKLSERRTMIARATSSLWITRFSDLSPVDNSPLSDRRKVIVGTLTRFYPTNSPR